LAGKNVYNDQLMFRMAYETLIPSICCINMTVKVIDTPS